MMNNKRTDNRESLQLGGCKEGHSFKSKFQKKKQMYVVQQSIYFDQYKL